MGTGEHRHGAALFHSGATSAMWKAPGWAGAIGVTRVARLTGLDRTGVEVACAIRPNGHVLQVSNGKGLTDEAARAGALSEAAELWAAERIDPRSLRFASWEDLATNFPRGAAWSPLELGSAGAMLAPSLWSSSVRLAWACARLLPGGERIWVPAQALYCLREGDWSLGPVMVGWTTNGMAAHPVRARAILHALLEASERHVLAQTLPEGWTPEKVASLLLPRRQQPGLVARLARRLEARGFAVFLFDLTQKRGAGLPVAGALLFDREGGPQPLTAGYACRTSREAALLGALLEAAQSRLTDVHGAREDVAPTDAAEAAALLEWCRAARPSRRPVVDAPSPGRTGGLGAVLSRLRAAGHGRIAVADLSPPGFPLHVVKVIVPTFERSELL